MMNAQPGGGPSFGRTLCLLWGVLLPAWHCAVEPIPTPQVDPQRLAVSALQAEDTQVRVIGRAGAAPAHQSVVLENEAYEKRQQTTADAKGQFVLAIAASAGDRLRIFVADHEAAAAQVPVLAVDPATTPPAPGSPVGTTIVASVVQDGLTTVTGSPAAARPGDAILAANGINGAVDETTAAADGSFVFPIAAEPGDSLVLLALRAGRSSAATVVTVPDSVQLPDQDSDGVADAADNCPETANADQADSDGDDIGDACDGPCTVDEDCSQDCASCVQGTCVIPPCQVCEVDADCPANQTCVVDPGGCCSSCQDSIPQAEICGDGVDNDQDGMVDEGCAQTDSDGDGFGADVDCDDQNAAINPGMAEICDGLDNDCDGVSDEDCPP